MIVTLFSICFIWFVVMLPFFSDVRREVQAVGYFGGMTWLGLWCSLTRGAPFAILAVVPMCITAHLTFRAAKIAWPDTFDTKQRYSVDLSGEDRSGL